jgi:hypothetical protein
LPFRRTASRALLNTSRPAIRQQGKIRFLGLTSTEKVEPILCDEGVTVEIKTGSRRIISYLLSPLMRYKQDSLRER